MAVEGPDRGADEARRSLDAGPPAHLLDEGPPSAGPEDDLRAELAPDGMLPGGVAPTTAAVGGGLAALLMGLTALLRRRRRRRADDGLGD